MIVTAQSQNLETAVSTFLKKIGARKALIRHDIRNEAPPYPRSGFLVPEHLIGEVLRFFFGLHRIVAVYEPADPLLNGYNLNVLFETAAHVWVEVVGPGFDASDLQRGDLSPHEVLSIAVSADGKVAEARRVSSVDEKTYDESRQLRVRKMKEKLRQSPTPELGREIFVDLQRDGAFNEYLKHLGSPLLRTETYIPISQALVVNTVNAIVNSDVIELFQCETGAGFPLNFSTSFVDDGRRQIYWDIVSPKLKFQGLK